MSNIRGDVLPMLSSSLPGIDTSSFQAGPARRRSCLPPSKESFQTWCYHVRRPASSPGVANKGGGGRESEGRGRREAPPPGVEGGESGGRAHARGESRGRTPLPRAEGGAMWFSDGAGRSSAGGAMATGETSSGERGRASPKAKDERGSRGRRRSTRSVFLSPRAPPGPKLPRPSRCAAGRFQ